MAKRKRKLLSLCNSKLPDLLRALKYTVGADDINHGFVKIFLATVLPTATAGLSFYLLSISSWYFVATVISMLYKLMVTLYTYQNYKQKYKGSTVAVLPETPLLVRLIVAMIALCFVVLVFCVNLFLKDELTKTAVWLLSAIINILLTWYYEFTDALAALYDADIPQTKC